MRTIRIKVYKFNELSTTVKEKVIDSLVISLLENKTPLDTHDIINARDSAMEILSQDKFEYTREGKRIV